MVQEEKTESYTERVEERIALKPEKSMSLTTSERPARRSPALPAVHAVRRHAVARGLRVR